MTITDEWLDDNFHTGKGVYHKINLGVYISLYIDCPTHCRSPAGDFREDLIYEIGREDDVFLSDYFQDWRNAAEEEICMFKLDTGLLWITEYAELNRIESELNEESK